MSDTKFTEGPWLVAGDAFVYSLFHTRGHERNKFVFQGSADVDCPREEMIANAHLVAASPELYRVLERLCDMDEGQALTDRLFAEARGVLKKARGEA